MLTQSSCHVQRLQFTCCWRGPDPNDRLVAVVSGGCTPHMYQQNQPATPHLHMQCVCVCIVGVWVVEGWVAVMDLPEPQAHHSVCSAALITYPTHCCSHSHLLLVHLAVVNKWRLSAAVLSVGARVACCSVYIGCGALLACVLLQPSYAQRAYCVGITTRWAWLASVGLSMLLTAIY